MAWLGIDLGGTYARAAVVDSAGTILSSTKTALQDRTPEAVVDAIGHAAHEALSTIAGAVEGCGVGVAGQLEGNTGRIAVAPNLGWRGVPFGEMLEAQLKRRVYVVNDLAAAAWGEFRAGAGRGTENLFVVFVGSGVGSAIISGGRLLRGETGVAGEFGHVKVVPGGRRCGCGELGCLEAYAGGHNLIAQMHEVLASGRPTMLRDLSGDNPARLTPVLLEDAALAGDPAAKEIYDRAIGFLSLAVANQITVLNPGKLVLGGGVLSRCLGFRQGIVAGVQQHTLWVARKVVKIEQAALGDDSGIIGAALLACELAR